MAVQRPVKLVDEGSGHPGLPFNVADPLFSGMLRRVRVEGDGNCLFYSLLVASGQSIEGYMQLRHACADFAASRWLMQIPDRPRGSTYAKCLNDSYRNERSDSEASFENSAAYVHYITSDRAWAGSTEIYVVSAFRAPSYTSVDKWGGSFSRHDRIS